MIVNTNKKIRMGKVFLVSIAIAVSSLAIFTVGLPVAPVQASGPSACPDPGQCTCNAASGVMTDHAMQYPFNRVNNGCTEEGPF